MTLYADRHDAGYALAAHVSSMVPAAADALVLGLPRGGVPVAYQVARVIGAELGVIVARKIGLPRHPELGVGAVTADGEPVFDNEALRHFRLTPADLEPIVSVERSEARRRRDLYRSGRTDPVVRGRTVIVVDDGLATGVTARAALRAVRAGQPARLYFAAPVCAAESVRALTAEFDDIVCMHCLDDFGAVGMWYDDFTQVGDDQVISWLERSAQRRSVPPPRQSAGGWGDPGPQRAGQVMPSWGTRNDSR